MGIQAERGGGSSEGRGRGDGRGSHFPGKMKQARGSGKSKRWRRRGNGQGKVKPQQWLAWGDLFARAPGLAVLCQVLLCGALSHRWYQHLSPHGWECVLGCSQAPGSAGDKTVRGQGHCPLPAGVSSGLARTSSCFGNSLTQESRFFLPPLFCCSLPPPPFSLSANAQQMGGNAILNATAS